MSDLQCPAVFVLLTPQTVAGSELRDQRLAGVYVASSIAAEAGVLDDARRLAEVHACRVENTDIEDEDALLDRIEQLADIYRGETVALVAPSRAVCAVIECLEPPDEPVAIAVDGDGIRLLGT
jgi:hypothetical protein